MNDREFIEDSLRRHQEHLGQVPPIECESPTGREPKLLWTPARQAIYNRMVEENSVWYTLICSKARNSNIYGDTGLWAAIAYQMTGDKEFSTLAWKRIQPILTAELNDDNSNREYSMERVLILDWCRPGWTQDQVDQYLVALDRLFNNALTPEVRTIDSDQVTGIYGGICFYAIGFGDEHPPAADFFNRTIVGGFTSTGRNRNTFRNCILDFVLMAEGGEWIESREYNTGTTRLLLMVYNGIGPQHFPEITDWLKGGALDYALMMTPDKKKIVQWGDEQEPHKFEVSPWATTAAMFDDPVARKVFFGLVELYGATGTYTAEPLPKAFLLLDPYGPVEDPKTTLFNSIGQGILTKRTNASMMFVHFPRNHMAPVDHTVQYANDFQFYRNGDWASTHPLTYGGYGNDGRALPSMLHCGLGIPKEFKNANEVRDNPDYLLVAGTCGGSFFDTKYYQPPPIYFHEFSRTYIWIYGEADTVVVFDRSHAQDPRLLPGYTKYNSNSQRPKMNVAPIRLWRWHMPVSPTINNNSAEWEINNVDTARVTWLRNDLIPTIENQNEIWGSNCITSERKFHLNLIPQNDTEGFQTLITVIQFGNSADFDDIDQITNGVSVCGKNITFDHTPGPKLVGIYTDETKEILENVRGDCTVAVKTRRRKR